MLLDLFEQFLTFSSELARCDCDTRVPYMRNAFKDTNPHLRALGQILDRLITLRVGHFTRQDHSIKSQNINMKILTRINCLILPINCIPTNIKEIPHLTQRPVSTANRGLMAIMQICENFLDSAELVGL